MVLNFERPLFLRASALVGDSKSEDSKSTAKHSIRCDERSLISSGMKTWP